VATPEENSIIEAYHIFEESAFEPRKEFESISVLALCTSGKSSIMKGGFMEA
jgi:hypothetical protein